MRYKPGLGTSIVGRYVPFSGPAQNIKADTRENPPVDLHWFFEISSVTG